MIISSSNLQFPFLNRLILRLTDRLYVNLMRNIDILRICPPFGLFKHSFAKVKDSASLNKDIVSGSCPVVYSSFRRSPASEAQRVLRPDAGPHEICIEKDARAAFTLSRYLSPCCQNSSFESRKRHRSLVTEASHFIPEPVIGSHRFDTDADRFFEGLDESEDFSGAMIWNGNFLNGIRFGIQSGISSRCGMQIDS